MSMRTLLMAIALAGLLGCPEAEDDLPTAAQVAPAGELRIEGDDVISILPGKHATLVVRYLDAVGAPAEGKWVDFALTGSPEGASLEAARAQTDSDGVAMTTLVAGREAQAFNVRASADGLEPQNFTIKVEAATKPTLVVSLSYEGKRLIKSYSLLVVEDMECDQLRNNASDTRTSSSSTDSQQTLYPGAGRTYAIAAWGSDDTNSKLALGCEKYTAPVVNVDTEAASQTLDIKLKDIAFTASTAIPLNFSFDVSQTLLSLAPAARSLTAAALPKTSTPEASFLLDALQARVNIASTRKSDGLDAELQRLLDAAPSGPLRFVEALTKAVAEDGAMCLLQGSLTPVTDSGKSTLTLSPPVYVVPSDSVAKEVSPNEVPLKGVTEFSASFDQDTAVVTVSALKIALGFGSYAAFLSKAIGQQPELYRERVAASTGCNELATLVSARPSSFGGLSAMDAVLSCQSALDALVPPIQSAWVALDAQRNTLSLKGALAAHDRDGDKRIDDLGPAMLEAVWSTAGAAPGGEAALKVSVRMSPVTVSAR
jgi:hypothetical protein